MNFPGNTYHGWDSLSELTYQCIGTLCDLRLLQRDNPWGIQLVEGTTLSIASCNHLQVLINGRYSCSKPITCGSSHPSRYPSNGDMDVDRKEHNNTVRSEEHTPELQALVNLVCRLLLEKNFQTVFTSEL